MTSGRMGRGAARPSEPTRVFLVGCPRSGTTLAQVMLGSHSTVASFPESHFFRILLGDRPRWRRWLGLGNPAVAGQLRRFAAEIADVEGAPSAGVFGSVRGWTDAFVGMMDRLALAGGKSLWVEKTPDHLKHTDLIGRLVPAARFVHVVRDGREVVASLYELSRSHPEVWGPPRSIDWCIERWRRAVETSLRCCGSAGARPHTMLRYDRLVYDTRAGIEELCGFLELELEAAMLRETGDGRPEVVVSGESWKSRAYDPPEATALERFRSCFEDEEQEYIADCVDELNRALGVQEPRL